MAPNHDYIIYESKPYLWFLGEMFLVGSPKNFLNRLAYDVTILVPIAIPCFCLYMMEFNSK